MATNWYALIGENVIGPIGAAGLKAMASQGQIGEQTLIRKGETGAWVLASQVQGLISPGATRPSIDATEPVAAEAQPTIPPPPVEVQPPHAETVPLQTPQASQSGSHRMLYWIIGGGVALVGFAVVMLTVVIGFIGVTYFRKADDEATRTITQELRQEAEIDAAEKREIQLQQEREAWLSANFKSELATKIRENAPQRESVLYDKLTDFNLQSLPSDWINASRTIHPRIYSGRLDHGSPFLIDENTLALLVTNGGLFFELWHIDLKSGNFRKVTEWKKGEDKGRYRSVTTHRKQGQIVQQFQFINVREQQRTPQFQGFASYGWLELKTGKMTSTTVEHSVNRNVEFMMQKLQEPQLPADTLIQITNGPAALSQANEKLARIGMIFDERQAAIHLDSKLSTAWQQSLRDISFSDTAAPEKLQTLVAAVNRAPRCTLIDNLKPTLQLAVATSRQDPQGVQAYLQGNPAHYLNQHGSMQLLHLHAIQGDEFEKYFRFQENDPGTPARDLAILRIHELAFTKVCQEASIEGFDKFCHAFPGALQSAQAFQNAYDLELERARFEIEHASDPDKKLEQIANGFYVQWRDALRQKNIVVAERLWKILTEETDFNRTQAASRTQDARDRDDYRAQMLKIQKERNEILTRIEHIQREQLAVAREQLQVAYEANAIARDGNAILGRINGNLNSIKGIVSGW